MTLDDLVKEYKNPYRFNRLTGMSRMSWYNWQAQGFIPIKTQFHIQQLTEGRLMADNKHVTGAEKWID